jgi:3-hydroxyacyl-CoA dehydrogenase
VEVKANDIALREETMNEIKTVAVIGAGTMGAAIAALAANNGLRVLLLDIVPGQLSVEEEAQGLSLAEPAVRNRIVQTGLTRAKTSRPPAFVDEAAMARVETGNLEDDFERLADVDWIIEVIIEKLEPKQALMARIEAVRKPGSIVSSNSSGLPMAQIAKGRSDDFRKHFLGTHFFNPPRYLKLLEVIPTQDTLSDVLNAMGTFVGQTLEKGVVLCKDTPNFIGNRLFVTNSYFAINHALAEGYTVAEIDAITGPLLGRPKTATFRLVDLVGVDIMVHIAHNLYDLIPHDPFREALRGSHITSLYDALLERQWLGNKSRQGFYRRQVNEAGEKLFTTLNTTTLEYETPPPTGFAAVEVVSGSENLGERLTALLEEQWLADRGAQYVRALLSYELAYAASVAQEIAHNLKSIDDTMRWGFGHQAGPFQLWDLLGVEQGVAMITEAGHPVTPWVTEMLSAGCNSFYRTEGDQVTGVYDWDSQAYK